MSDCSTEAMKPKERSKKKIGYVLRWKINDPDDTMSQITEVDVNDHRFIEEQRYQQLEQIAREMFKRAYEFNRGGSYPSLGGIYIADFREQLEALGVEIDE